MREVAQTRIRVRRKPKRSWLVKATRARRGYHALQHRSKTRTGELGPLQTTGQSVSGASCYHQLCRSSLLHCSFLFSSRLLALFCFPLFCVTAPALLAAMADAGLPA